MAEILTRRKRLTKRAIGAESIGDMNFTVIGKRRFFASGRYTVMISSDKEKGRTLMGNFNDVFFSMKDNEGAKKGVPLLREVADALSDPERTLANAFTDVELVCINVLKDGPKSLEDMADATQLEGHLTAIALGGLETLGLVSRCRRRGDPPKGYTLTRKGKRKAVLLADERDFVLVKSQLAESQETPQTAATKKDI